MKNLFAAVAVMMMAGTAMADVDTVCTGGGKLGNDIKIQVTHTSGEIGSVSDYAYMNDELVDSVLESKAGNVMRFVMDTGGHVASLDYNFMDATAILNLPGYKVNMFCSRGR